MMANHGRRHGTAAMTVIERCVCYGLKILGARHLVVELFESYDCRGACARWWRWRGTFFMRSRRAARFR